MTFRINDRFHYYDDAKTDSLKLGFYKLLVIIYGMLTKLSIQNLAIIENIDITFKDGFTVLTGETGAGKSLIIDSLSLLLGERASNELIRQGESKASITGFFKVKKSQIESVLYELNIPYSEEICVQRILSKTKNIIKINETAVTLNDLLKISKYLADIHSQFDYAKILNPDNYLDIVDGFGGSLIASYKDAYKVSLLAYENKKEEYSSLIAKQKKLEENHDFYEFQYNELSKMGLQKNEENEIKEEISLLKNYDKIYSLEEEIASLIDSDFLDKYYDLNKSLLKLSSFQEQFTETQKNLDDNYYSLVDTLQNLKKQFHNSDYDPNRLNELLERQSEIDSLERKYKKSYDELLAYSDELKELLENKDSFTAQIEKVKEELDKSFQDVLIKGKDLTSVRKNIAKTIEKELTQSLKDLLLDVRFEIEFKNQSESEDILKENGVDDIDFLIETNVGEGLKSLSKVISGGEASRIMLAFKALFIKANKIPTVVFDEIDTGISGETAEAVAKKIKEISKFCQVIAITHMPQVASKSDYHILISKKVKDGRTFASIKELSLEDKINQIAYLISGGNITEKQKEYAKEMVLGANG